MRTTDGHPVPDGPANARAALPGPLVAVVGVAVVTALAGVPGIGPETWEAVADGGALARATVAAGPAGLGVLHAVTVLTLVLAIAPTVRHLDALRRLVVLVVAVAPATVVPAGPRLAGLVLASLVLVVWRKITATRGRSVRTVPGLPVVLLVLLVALWSLLEPGWVLGPLIGIVAGAGAALDARRFDPSVASTSARPEFVVIVSTLSVGVTVTATRLFLGEDRASAVATLRAWVGALWSGSVPGGAGPRPLTDPVVLLVALPLLLVVGSWLRRGAAPSWSSTLWAGLALLLAVGPAGPAPAAGLVAAPVLAEALASRTREVGTDGRRPLAVVVGVALLLGAPVAAVTSARSAASDPVVGLYAALRALPPGTPVLADPRVGPRAAIGAGAAVARVGDDRLLAALRAEPGWREVVRGSGARAALLTDEAPLLAALQERLGWRVTARSGADVLVRAPG